MRTMTDARWPGIAMTAAALLLASCSGEQKPPARPAAQNSPAAVVAADPSLPPATPVRPAGADEIDAALAAARAFNAKALTDLTAIAPAEKRIRDQASRALEAAGRGDAARVTAAQNDAEAAHKSLTDALSSFRDAAAEQQEAVAAALVMCGPQAAAPGATQGSVTPPRPPVVTPLPGAPATAAPLGPGVYEGCLALAAEQVLLTQNIDAVTARHQAAETAYLRERPKLEEAAATMALSRLGPL